MGTSHQLLGENCRSYIGEIAFLEEISRDPGRVPDLEAFLRKTREQFGLERRTLGELGIGKLCIANLVHGEPRKNEPIAIIDFPHYPNGDVCIYQDPETNDLILTKYRKIQ